jgi:integrase
VKNGNRYWQPTKAMQEQGFHPKPLGKDDDRSRKVALGLYEAWLRVLNNCEPAPVSPLASREMAECARRYPPNSIGDSFQRWIRTNEWSGIPHSTRTKVLWPAWFRIRDAWAEAAPDTMTFELISEWRAELVEENGVGVAHKTLKFWRKLWKIMRALKTAKGDDPSLGMRNTAPAPRWQTYTEGEAVILVKRALRAKQYELACVIAVTWDTLFSPGDVRTLVGRHIAYKGKTLWFDRSIDGRIKTGRAAIGTVSRRTQRLCEAVWAWRGVEITAEAFAFRKSNGSPWRDHELAKAFNRIRDVGDGRQLRDMRRSGSGEGNSGGANPGLLSAKLANSIQTSNALHKTYAPVDRDAVIAFDRARLAGRQKRRAENEN